MGHLGISRKLDHILEDGELNAGKTEFLGSNLNNADPTDAILANGKTSTVLTNTEADLAVIISASKTRRQMINWSTSALSVKCVCSL